MCFYEIISRLHDENFTLHPVPSFSDLSLFNYLICDLLVYNMLGLGQETFLAFAKGHKSENLPLSPPK